MSATQDMRHAERGDLAPPGHVATGDGADGCLVGDADIAFWHEHGYLRIPQVFDDAEMAALEADFEWMLNDWAPRSAGWAGPWRKVLMDEATEAKCACRTSLSLPLNS